MPMQSISTIPLNDQLFPEVKQVWYTDDATAVAKLSNLVHWWDDIRSHGPIFRYFANAKKTWLVV